MRKNQVRRLPLVDFTERGIEIKKEIECSVIGEMSDGSKVWMNINDGIDADEQYLLVRINSKSYNSLVGCYGFVEL